MNIFYHPIIDNDTIILDETESLHAVKVLRMQTGDKALLFDGAGGKFEVEIVNPHHKRCELKILKKEFIPQRNFHIHIAIAPTKLNERMEWFLEKATEIGIDEITPVICKHSERKQINHDRFTKILIAAMKQSLNARLPKLNELTSFEQFIKTPNPGFIANYESGKTTHLKKIDFSANEFKVIIGPEGDFSNEEITLAQQENWKPVSLGDSRLRTETAGIVACHIINLFKV